MPNRLPNPEAFDPASIRWLTPEGAPVSCVEKLKVLTETLNELRDVAQDTLEDALVIGCDESQIRAALAALISSLQNPYRRD